MTVTSKEKRVQKPNTKPCQKQQSSLKANEQVTIRMSKSSGKNFNISKSSRSPQMIKLMIEQLEKQLLTKTKSKKITQTHEWELNTTKRKSTKNKNTEFDFKNTVPSQNPHWKSPSKKKNPKLEQPKKAQPTIFKTLSESKSSSKLKACLQSQPLHHTSKKNPIKTNSNKKQSKKDDSNSNYIFLDNDLIQFPNLQLPLFILDNSQIWECSDQFSHRKDNKSLLIDQKHTFLRHSKTASFDSINSKTHRPNHIERSFCQSDQSQQDSSQNLSFFKLNILDKSPISQQQTSQNLLQSNLIPKTSPHQTININRVIQLNNSAIKIQKWWQTQSKPSKIFNPIQSGPNKKESLETIETIDTKEEESQKNIESLYKIGNKQPKSISEKIIPFVDSNEHSDILKLRQNAAHIQFSTHEQILKQLLNNSKITETQFEHQFKLIQDNLSLELDDINRVRNILTESAQKVKNIMKQTKRDIATVKTIVLQKNTNSHSDNFNNPALTNKPKEQPEHEQDILVTIFGRNAQKQLIKKQITNNLQSSQQTLPDTNLPLNRYKRIKIPTYETQLDEFANQPSEDDSNSFLSNQNKPIFNSPNTHSNQNLPSPNSQKNQSLSSSQNLEQEIFACQIQSSSSSHTPQSPFPLTANFEQLYKSYQQQQESKRQIESRISSQLGVPDPLRPSNQAQIGINTSIVAIHKFLLNFFKFYLYYHKHDFLTYMNMPYGESIETRMAKNKLKCPEYALQQWTKTTFYTEDDEQIVYGLKNVIPESVLEDFFDSYYEQTDLQFTQAEKNNIELQKIHNRALFHAFNQALNFFRPYYNIGGAPYLWCSSEKSLTFFCIGEDNIQQVYEKTLMKILKTSSHLCGVIIDICHKQNVVLETKAPIQPVEFESPFKVMQNQSQDANKTKKVDSFEEYLQSYSENFNPAYLSNLEERLKKKEQAETEEQNLEWFGNTFEQGKVATLLNLTELIEQIILLEECSILLNIHEERNTQNATPETKLSTY